MFHPRPFPSRLLAVLLTMLLPAASFAAPMTFTDDVSFATGSPAPSLWGPGGSSSSFGVDGSAGIPRVSGPFDVQITPGLGVSYDFSASSGSVSANVNGTLSAGYDDYLSLPGTTSISLGYTPTSGGFSTDLGARADLEGYVNHIPFGDRWDFCFYCRNWSLQTSSSATPGFGVTRTDTDSVSVAGVGPSFLSLASAQANINATQRGNFRLDSFEGILTFENLTTGTNGIVPFLLAGTSVLDLTLPEVGVWDIGFVDLDLDNTFWSTMGASLSFDIDVFGIIDESWTFASLNLLNTGGFELDFPEHSIESAFQIVVPEPGTGLLLGAGLLGLMRLGRPGRRS